MKLYSPSQLITFIDSPYASWYDRASREKPELFSEMKDEEDKLQSVLQAKGFEHEKKILEEFRAKGLKIIENAEFGAVATAIVEGFDVIYQAKLTTERFCGDADFIVKENGEYVIYDTKLAKQVKPYMIYQLCIYTEALGLILGEMPKNFKVITGTGEIITYRTMDYFHYFKAVESDFLSFHERFDFDDPPKAEDYLSHGNWSEYAEAELIKKDHLSLIANITRKNIKALEAFGINTVSLFLEAKFDPKFRIEEETFEKLKLQAELQKKSNSLEVPIFKIKKDINIPPKSPEDLYFDMEGYPLYGKQGLEYLFGVTKADGSFIDFWAHDEIEEKKAFSLFIDLAMANFKKNKKFKIYHYASYEVSAMRRLSTQYGLKENEVDTLLRNDVFIDLYKIVKDSLVVGAKNYSIKSIEKCYRPKRDTEVTTAGDSVVAYANWIASGESKEWIKSPLLKAIRDYNKDDCDSTLELADWLRTLMNQSYVEIKELEGSTTAETPESITREELLAKHGSEDPVFLNLTYLLDFNKRKDKPMWWRYFDRYSMTKVEMEDDLNFLSEFKVVKIDDRDVYGVFDPGEETKIKSGDSCVTKENVSFKVLEIDNKKGTIRGQVSKKNIDSLPAINSLMLHSYFSTQAIDKRIYDFVTNYHKSPKRYTAIRDFLSRSRPRLIKDKTPLVRSDVSRTEEALKIIDLMDSTTICIQGPPGTGKTYTASKMIAQSVRKGKKVCILSNSHKAIINLLNGAMAEFKGNEKVSALKVGDSSSEDISDSRVEVIDSLKNVGNYNIYAMTIYALAKCPEEFFDYLFIDEAGQVAIANLIAGGMSAKNIIMMGDQQQLPQPVEGSHPLDTGDSLLDYYLKGQATIDDDFGIFLNVTYRMHSSIAQFISDSIYEGKLISDPANDLRVVKNQNKKNEESGIIYVPIPHSGNSQGSIEERKAIIELTKSILGREKTDKTGRVIGIIGMEDILFVAPYNLQVSLLTEDLEKAFGGSPQVGSVDKFQGQEAPIVICSMCTSSELDIGSRGIDFLFSLNRLNVAITRAKSMAFIVASPDLMRVRTGNIEKMKCLNFWNYLMKNSKVQRS